jgi:hypothetical protein
VVTADHGNHGPSCNFSLNDLDYFLSFEIMFACIIDDDHSNGLDKDFYPEQYINCHQHL